jgi:hypothetical protein
MAESKVRKFEHQAPRSPSFKPAPRPSPKLQPAREEALPVEPKPLAEEERKSLVLKLIDFLETF